MTVTIEAAREMLGATRRALQVTNECIAKLKSGRRAVSPSDDVPSEHKVAWLGAVDEDTRFPLSPRGRPLPGVNFGLTTGATTAFGWNNPKRGKIRNQEDAAFVCTDILVAVGLVVTTTGGTPWLQMLEHATDFDTTTLFLRLVDGNTGRSLVGEGTVYGSQPPGATQAPREFDRGMISFSRFSSVRPGLGPNVKNRLFSEFPIPRAGVVDVEVYNFGGGATPTAQDAQIRAFVALLGYRVYGG
jgi:hypothetical protein